MRTRSTRVLRGAVGVAGLLVAAELALRAGHVTLLPLVSTVLLRAAELTVDGEFLSAAASTLASWAAGLALTVAVGIPIGLLLGAMPKVEAVVRPLIEFLRPIPSVALIPLAILVFTEQLHLRAAIVIYAACWPVLINTIYGLKDVDPVAKETLRSFGFGPLAVLVRVSLPSAAPFIATGIRLAASVAIVLAVSVELVAGGTDGVGVYIIKAGGGGRTDLMIAATVLTGLFGLLVNVAFVAVERKVFRWRHAR
ncbi:ABC transporter permease [Microbispora sp. RL4-1S]|uniref:ABC transporter permease n=1 Tax=Microbispora oryzae TaxID=2806554 RepID=A0A941AQY1_9ACTN|nr:ABC transporter permease [Microbispora oryzae]